MVAGNISADEIKRTLVDAASAPRSLRRRRSGAGEASILVAEISSFQLEWVERFAPRGGDSDQYHARPSEPL